jgi:hypothetical protein
MARPPKPLKVAGYPVERVSVGGHTLGVITVRDDVTVMFQIRDGRPGTGGDSSDCLTCKISKISECADEVCPEIKAENPNASCSDAIQACTERKCRDRCGGGLGGAFGGGILVIA